MGRGRLVTAPDGARWRVRRRWLDRSVPNIGRRYLPRPVGGLEGLLQTLNLIEGSAVIAAITLALLIIFVLLPLLGVALELIILIFVLCSGVTGRLFLGRPWIVEAKPEDGDEAAVRVPVKGWRRAGEVAARLGRVIEATGRPEEFEGAREAREVPGR